MENEPKSAKRRSWKSVLLYAGTALLVIMAALAGFDLVGARKLGEQMRRAQAIGGPVTLQELMAARRKWPEGENGAQVVLGVQERLQTLTSNRSLADLPVVGGAVSPLGRRWSEKQEAAAREFLEDNKDLLAKLGELAKYEGGQMPFTVAPMPFDTLLPSLAWLRSASKLESLQAICEAHSGTTERLAEHVRLMRLDASLVQDEPTLISQLVFNALNLQAVHTVEQILALAPVGASELKTIEGLLVPLEDASARIEWGLRSERAFFLASTDYMRTNGNKSPNYGPSFPPASSFPGAGGYVMQDQARGLSYFNRLIKAVNEGRALQEARAVDAELPGVGVSAVFTRTLFPSLSRAISRQMQMAAEARCARVALAAEHFRLESGRLPGKLEELVPKYIDAIPDDPFKPKTPLRMVIKQDRLLVYSVGDNGADDGGDFNHDQKNIRTMDCGFILMLPEYRNLAPLPQSSPASEPDSEIGQPATGG